MNIRDLYTSKAIATVHNEAASNKQAFLGAGLFPTKQKMGLDLSWIKAHKGLPVSLMPSNFDAKSTIRSREGIKKLATEMAFFRESMLVSEKDEQEIMRLTDANDPYAQQAFANLFNDAQTLIEGAEVVAERMRMQLLAPVDGHPSISIEADGASYKYNYDADGSYAKNNYEELLTTAKWDAPATADPIADIISGRDAVEALTGSRPSLMIVSRDTLNKIKACDSIKNAILAQNVTANVVINDARVKEIIASEAGVTVIVYTKQFKTEAGVVQKFYPDGYATLIPDGALGNTYKGVTPEQRTLMGSGEADVTVVDGGTAVAVSTTVDPVNTKTTVSQIILPSYERMDETFVIKAY